MTSFKQQHIPCCQDPNSGRLADSLKSTCSEEDDDTTVAELYKAMRKHLDAKKAATNKKHQAMVQVRHCLCSAANPVDGKHLSLLSARQIVSSMPVFACAESDIRRASQPCCHHLYSPS